MLCALCVLRWRVRALHAEMGTDALQHALPEGCCLTCQTTLTDWSLWSRRVRFSFADWNAVLIPDRSQW